MRTGHPPDPSQAEPNLTSTALEHWASGGSISNLRVQGQLLGTGFELHLPTQAALSIPKFADARGVVSGPNYKSRHESLFSAGPADKI